MVPWIQVYSNLSTHPKTYALADALKIENYSAVGLIVSLWLWASVNAPNGDITSFPPRAITEATGWKKKPNDFYELLMKIRLIERVGDRVVIHDWEDYATLLMELLDRQKKKTAERVNRYRNEKKAREAAAIEGDTVTPQKTECSVTGNVTGALCNAPTRPDQTVPYITPYLSDGVDARARETQEALADFMEARDLSPERYFGYTDEIGAQAERLAQEIYVRFALKPPTKQDVICVFNCLRKSIQPLNPEDHSAWRIEFPKDKVDLLIYAFEIASRNGTPGNWNYITGVLKKLHQRGIQTLEEADNYEASREIDRDMKRG